MTHAGILPGHSIRGVPQVGEIDADNSVEFTKSPDGIIAAGIIDEGQPESHRYRLPYGADNLGNEMRRSHQIYIVTLQIVLEIEHALRQSAGTDLIVLLVFRLLANLVILAIYATHIAVSKEYRSRAPSAGKNRLLAVVGANGRNNGI
jgi:hypothetical protein